LVRYFKEIGPNVAYHRMAGSSNDVELNAPFALFLSDSRAYVLHKKEAEPDPNKPSPIIIKTPPPYRGSFHAPGSLVLADWDVSRGKPTVLPGDFYQWILKSPGDHRTRSIPTQRVRLSDEWFLATEQLALFNTSANAFLLFDSEQGVVGWRAR
jgi:hypothetical protein